MKTSTTFKKGHIGYKFWLGKKRDLLTNLKISRKLKGRPLSEKTKLKMSVARKGKPQPWHKGKSPWNKGIKCPQFAKENHWNWQGGISLLNDRHDSSEYKQWRQEVFRRDSGTCVICGYKSKGRGGINADHIKSFTFFPELRFDVTNGRTLCIKCHKKTENYGYKAKLLIYG